MKTKSKKDKTISNSGHVMSSAPVPRCIYCGADEDDAFVAGEPCVKCNAEPKDLGAEGQNGQVEFNGSQYELTRADFQMIADALDIVNPDSEPAIKRAFKLTRIFSQLAGSKRVKRARDTRPKVGITVKNGTIQDIEFIPKTPKTDITIYDYDVDGVEERLICKDDRGKSCLITKW